MIGVANEGYSTFYENLLPHFVNLNVHNNYIVHNGIHQIDKLREKNLNRKSSKDFKRARKHKIKAKIAEQVYEDRITKKNNYGTYESGFNFRPESEQENSQTTIITTGEAKKTKTKNAKSKQKQKSDGTKGTEKFCKWCDKFTNHTTWVSKSCSKHNEWRMQQKVKKGKNKELTVGDKENEEETKKGDVSNVAYDDAVGDDGDGRMRFGDGGTGALDLLCVVIENDTNNDNNSTVLI